MDMDYMTCMEMYLNGVGIGMEHIQMKIKRIMLDPIQGLPVFFAAVTGTISRRAALRRIGTATIRTAATFRLAA